MSQDQTQTKATLINESEVNANPFLSMVVEKDSELKDYLVEYVGTKLESENVTVEMITEVLATEFPEIVLTLAEENFLLGYKQGLNDADKLSETEANATE